MANQILIKRSAVASKAPATTDLQLGELAINTNDGKLYLKKNNGTETIVEVGPVTSVAGHTGAIVLTSTDVAEGTRLYYTDARARAANSVAGVGLSYNSTTGVISSNATSANTANTIMSRDANGAFSAGTANLAGSLYTTGMVALNGATGAYSGYSSGMTLNYTGIGSQHGISLKPGSSTVDTNAINFLSSTSTYTTATSIASIQHMANDAGANLSGSWRINGNQIVAVNPTSAKAGDVRVVGSVISMYDGSAWKQVFPAVYA